MIFLILGPLLGATLSLYILWEYIMHRRGHATPKPASNAWGYLEDPKIAIDPRYQLPTPTLKSRKTK